ncbi:hypoxanthine phosphoribosyltransferase [Runella sp. CRIBMP]|mgnify:FL=1|uniref:hypoxanthine phosphoribosyltransferase n=1 Tax=Runella sp. CRIBMP TaxID=2683261 RepID=UPI001411E261|nr:hypoxanthine phosphoribosyltransferase [Runella sp. CRIBMP]NBB19759.1 hypoxanthine phosphoribosyltransferase [Runella sp. CRIBMP]
MQVVKDKRFVPFIDKQTLEERIAEVGRKISEDYRDKNPLFVVVLNGAFLFAAELIKNVPIPCEITFVRVSSYSKTESTGQLKEILGLKESIEGRHVIIVEDIVDTGLTMNKLLFQLSVQKPDSIQVASMLFKPAALKTPLTVKYVGFEIENRFVVGYGLDYDEQGRNLDAIYVLAD